MQHLDSIFNPRSIAVIGASRQQGSVGFSLLANLIDSRFQGIVYPVNPKADGILGIKCHKNVLDIPDPVDMAVVIVPAPVVPSILEECGERGIKGVITISAGFKEIGGRGIELEQKVREVIQKYDISLIGPNCLGVINTAPDISMNATFGTQMPLEGNIAFLSQSGALCVAVLDYAKEANVGFSKFISMGNKAGVNENTLLRYLREDERTHVILMYLEDLSQGREFMALAKEITDHPVRPKPVIALKAGRTVIGAKAVSSHTGSLAGSDRVYDAIFKQSGVIRGNTLEEIFDYVKAFSTQPLPKGSHVAIVTNSGGPGILATDAIITEGLKVPPFSEDTKKRLRKHLSDAVGLNNPLDLIAEAQEQQYEASLDILLADSDIHSAMVILTPTAFTHVDAVAHAIVRTAKKYGKPVVCCFLGVYDVSSGVDILEENNIPTYRFPESAGRVLAELTKFTWWLNKPPTRIREYDADRKTAAKMIDFVRGEGRTFLMEHEAYSILQAYGFPVIRSKLARTAEEAAAAGAEIGFPVAMKIASPDVIHKFDFGGVRLNIQNAAEAEVTFRDITDSVLGRIPGADIKGILVEEMVGKGQEVILGVNRDPQFGPLLMFGLGGIYVEVLEDVSFRLAPVTELSAKRMIRTTKTYKILDGYRGGPLYDIEAVEDCLTRLSQLVMDFEAIRELDINPLIVFEKGRGCLIVDARIILSD
ncbi:MAG: acetate--CoA ligase family protein [Acidobacteria bacterium]|nr:acetate--CoA ligase family protein [Acidobacteriota bacterium]